MSLNDFLIWLSGGGSVIAFSFIMERIPWFQNLASQTKQWIMFVGCAVITCGAFAIQRYVPIDTLTQIAPFFGLIASVFASVFLAKAFHKADKKTDTNSDGNG